MGSSLLIRNTQSPGDIIVLSAMLRDLHIAHPGKFTTSIAVSPGAEEAYFNNPNISKIIPAGRASKDSTRQFGKPFVAHYPLIKTCNQQRKHFLWGFIEDVNKRLHTNVKLTQFRPDLHMTEQEMAEPLIEPPYWLFLAGGKTDFRTKIWSREYWKQVIGATKDRIRWVQCGGGSKNHIMHEQIPGVQHYMVAKTGLRKFIRLIYHAEGVVCVVTAAMHIAAALNKPCVVIAGGREPWWWEGYTQENRIANMRISDPRWTPPADDDFVEHKFLHTMNKLSCCKNKGCWRSKLKGSSVCHDIVEVGGQLLPKCKAMITPDQVIGAMNSYYEMEKIKSTGVITTVDKAESVLYCVYGKGDPELEATMPETPVVVNGCSREEALRTALKTDTEWVVWAEAGSRPKPGWFERLYLTRPRVMGRIYRTQTRTHYPHPGLFIAHRDLIDTSADTFEGMFAKLRPADFTSIDQEVTIPVRL